MEVLQTSALPLGYGANAPGCSAQLRGYPMGKEVPRQELKSRLDVRYLPPLAQALGFRFRFDDLYPRRGCHNGARQGTFNPDEVGEGARSIRYRRDRADLPVGR